MNEFGDVDDLVDQLDESPQSTNETGIGDWIDQILDAGDSVIVGSIDPNQKRVGYSWTDPNERPSRERLIQDVQEGSAIYVVPGSVGYTVLDMDGESVDENDNLRIHLQEIGIRWNFTIKSTSFEEKGRSHVWIPKRETDRDIRTIRSRSIPIPFECELLTDRNYVKIRPDQIKILANFLRDYPGYGRSWNQEINAQQNDFRRTLQLLGVQYEEPSTEEHTDGFSWTERTPRGVCGHPSCIRYQQTQWFRTYGEEHAGRGPSEYRSEALYYIFRILRLTYGFTETEIEDHLTEVIDEIVVISNEEDRSRIIQDALIRLRKEPQGDRRNHSLECEHNPLRAIISQGDASPEGVPEIHGVPRFLYRYLRNQDIRGYVEVYEGPTELLYSSSTDPVLADVYIEMRDILYLEPLESVESSEEFLEKARDVCGDFHCSADQLDLFLGRVRETNLLVTCEQGYVEGCTRLVHEYVQEEGEFHKGPLKYFFFNNQFIKVTDGILSRDDILNVVLDFDILNGQKVLFWDEDSQIFRSWNGSFYEALIGPFRESVAPIVHSSSLNRMYEELQSPTSGIYGKNRTRIRDFSLFGRGMEAEASNKFRCLEPPEGFVDPGGIICGDSLVSVSDGSITIQDISPLRFEVFPTNGTDVEIGSDDDLANWRKYLSVYGHLEDDTIDFVEKVLGTALFGFNKRTFLNVIGGGNSGKSTFSRILSTVFGNYSSDFTVESFEKEGEINVSLANTIVNRYRLLVFPEDKGNKPFTATILNKLSGGGDNFTARFLQSNTMLRGPSIGLPLVYSEEPINILGATVGTRDRRITLLLRRMDSSEVDLRLINQVENPKNPVVRGCLRAIIEAYSRTQQNERWRSDVPNQIRDWGDALSESSDPVETFIQTECERDDGGIFEGMSLRSIHIVLASDPRVPESVRERFIDRPGRSAIGTNTLMKKLLSTGYNSIRDTVDGVRDRRLYKIRR